MQASRGVDAYRQTDMQTMSKEKLIVLLYQKVLEHLSAAAEHAGGDRIEMARRLGLAQRIVTELRGALDHKIGGEVAENLAALYDFVFKEIMQMHVDNEPVHVTNCRQVLLPLFEAWSRIPPGSAEREIRVRQQPGTEPAKPAQEGAATAPAPDPDRERLIMTTA